MWLCLVGWYMPHKYEMYTDDTMWHVKYDNVAFGEEREWTIERENTF